MKKISCLVLFLAFALAGLAQTKDVVYLKNGSIIKANILEYKMGESIKFETADGSVYVYAVGDVLKTTKNTEALNEPASTVKGEAPFDGQYLTDIDGNKYRTVTVNGMVWMAENLRAKHYADGMPVSEGEKKYCSKNEEYLKKYGLLYNWLATMRIEEYDHNATQGHVQGVCPTGWHVPTVDEYYRAMGGKPADKAARKKIENEFMATEGWDKGKNGNNASGFTALPAGQKGPFGSCNVGAGQAALFWTATSLGNIWQSLYYVGFPSKGNKIVDIMYDSSCLSVRCVKNY